MLLAFTALALGAAPLPQQVNHDAESRCIYDEAHNAGPVDGAFEKAKAACVARYHWTDGDAQRAIQVTACIFGLFKARSEAQDAGIDFADIDAMIDAVGEKDLMLLGNPDQVPEIRDPIIRKIAFAATAKYGVTDKGKKARTVVFNMALLLFRSGDFSSRYGQPG
jgi:hypothetical protein